MSGKVYIASMNLRGKWASRPENVKLLNVTSAQGKENKNRRDFSPMTESNFVGFGGDIFYNFEAFWQSGKVFDEITEEKTKKFWKNVKEAKRRFPGSKGKKVLYSKWDGKEEKMGYIESRKKVYIPLYHDLTKEKEMTLYWKEEVEKGQDVVIYDFDGPRLDDGSVTCLEVNIETLQEKVNDHRFPFGHGYVVAALLKGISLSDFM